MASSDEFLETAQLGAIATGLSKDAVRELLGEPESISVQKSPEIWKYGSLQLAFYPDGSDALLVSMTLHFHDPNEHAPKLLALGGWYPSGETTFDEFRAHLDEVGIRVFGGVDSGPHQHLVLESADRVTFDEGRLYSIGHATKREPKLKQYPVTIRSSDLDTIRREASIQGISIAALCSRWIEERVANFQPH